MVCFLKEIVCFSKRKKGKIVWSIIFFFFLIFFSPISDMLKQKIYIQHILYSKNSSSEDRNDILIIFLFTNFRVNKMYKRNLLQIKKKKSPLEYHEKK